MRTSLLLLATCALAASAIASCSKKARDYDTAASEIAAVGIVPLQVKLLGAKMLSQCGVPAKGRRIFQQWEAPAGRAPYTLQLSRDQFEDARARSCLKAQADGEDARHQIDIGVEPPAPTSSQSSVKGFSSVADSHPKRTLHGRSGYDCVSSCRAPPGSAKRFRSALPAASPPARQPRTGPATRQDHTSPRPDCRRRQEFA